METGAPTSTSILYSGSSTPMRFWSDFTSSSESGVGVVPVPMKR